MSSSISSSDPASWARFFRRAAASAAAGCAAIFAFVALVDPWGVLPFSIPAERPPVSTNARYAFAGLARSDRFDSAIIGTSTSRMLIPDRLNGPFGARFANLAMNAATAYEQSRLFEVFIRRHPAPRAVILGLDHVWCEPGPLQRFTPRPFPEAFYGASPWPAYREMLSFYAVQEAVKQAAVLVGLKPPPYGRDGYTRFLPPDDRYDAARVAASLPPLPPETLRHVETPPARIDLPAMALLERMVAATPAQTRLVVMFMPLWLGTQAAPGTGGAAVTEACKRRVAEIARARPGTVVMDFLRASPITRDPTHYWDPMHYRDAIAERIMAHLARAADGAPDASEDFAALAP
ncbi:hypothetical protein [Neoroseomonas rubea]|uniref:hypothetical protein n=1 Tax=Neoroseomonas rubea TaxID=2748666 RepID=UPI0018DF2F9A|nr:hypothetical protein [Roseomonas rubea]